MPCIRTRPSVPVSVSVLASVLVLIVAAGLLGACARAGSSPNPPVRVASPVDDVADAVAWRTVTAIGPPAAGLELETVHAGERRHTTLRSVAGTVLEHRIDGPHWYVRSELADAGLPVGRWVHVDLDELRAAGVEVPDWLGEGLDDAGFVFGLEVGDDHAGEVVRAVHRDADRVTVVFESGLRARGVRTVLPADTVVELPTPEEVIELEELMRRT